MLNRSASPERGSATLGKIRAAARSIFYAKGFHASSVEEIAERSGVSRATIYLHFRSKDELLLDLLKDDLNYQMLQYDQLASVSQITKASVKKWLLAFRAAMDERRGSLTLFSVAFNLVSELESSVDRHREAAIAKLGSRFTGFDLDALDRTARNFQRVKCYMMIFLIEGVAVTFSSAPSAPSLESGVDVLAAILFHFLRYGEIRTL